MAKLLDVGVSVRLALQVLSQHHPDAHLVLAVSGGLDSMVMLSLLHQQIFEFKGMDMTVVHVNHGLSANACDWQDLVAQQAQSRHRSFKSETITLSSKANLESQAREARYAVFMQEIEIIKRLYPKVTPVLVLGHHQDDMAEHFLLRLMRAAGPAGLAGPCAIERHFLGFMVWRPLLNLSRSQLYDYAALHSIPHVEDESNTDTTYDRNYIRHTLMPGFKSRWPHALQVISQSQKWCAESAALNDELACIDLKEFVVPLTPAQIPALKVTFYKQLSWSRAKNLIRYWLALQGIKQLRDSLWLRLQAQLSHDRLKPTTQIMLDNSKSLFLSFAYECMYVCREYTTYDASLDDLIAFDSAQLLKDNYGVVLVEYSNFNFLTARQSIHYPHILNLHIPSSIFENFDSDINWYWRLGRSNETIKLCNKPYAMAIKKIWQEFKIPFYLRSRWPLLVNAQSQVLYIPGVGFTRSF